MAKSLTDIENEIIAAKNADSNLAALNSPSLTAIWLLWVKLIAFVHRIIYVEWDRTKTELSTIAAQQIIGTAAWYEGLALAFNYVGSPIIARASAREVITTYQRKVILKVAKQTLSGLTNLTSAELAALKIQINARKVVGTDLDIISQTADLTQWVFSIRYTGTAATVKADVITALKLYLKNLPYNEVLSKSLVIDALLQVPGVLDISIDSLKVNIGLGYNEITGNSVIADAGYFEVGKAAGVDLITANMFL